MNTKTKFPPIALGTWAWGSGYVGGKLIFGNTIPKEIISQVYHKALEEEFTLFDTAPVYGYGEAERLLGEFSKNQDVLIATKFMPFYMQRKKAMKLSLEKSMKRLNRKQVDIFWIHVPTNVHKWTTEIIPILQKNKTRYVGVSNHNLSQIKEAKKILEAAGLSLFAVQNHFSLLYLDCLNNGILFWCKEHDILFFSYLVLEQGALTSHYHKEHPFPKYSRRARAFPPETLFKIEPLIQEMRIMAQKRNVEVSEIAIAHALYHQTIPIIGVTKVKHIESLKRALSITLTLEEVLILEAKAKMTNVEVKGFWERKL